LRCLLTTTFTINSHAALTFDEEENETEKQVGQAKGSLANPNPNENLMESEGIATASTKDRVIVLGVMPFVGMVIGLFFYSCLPLYMIDRGMDLTHLGYVAAASIICRMLVPLVGWRFVPLQKLAIPGLSLALVTGLLNVAFPGSSGVIYLNVFAVHFLLPSRSVAQAAVVLVWPNERIKALRIFEGCYTLGYCLSSLWGSGLYYIGGWSLCIWVQVWTLTVTLALACSVDILRPSRSVFTAKALAESKNAGSSSPQAVHVTPASSNVAETECVVAGADTMSKGGDTCKGGRHDLRKLKLFICLAPAVIIFAYASEWCLYLVYLSEKFDMNPLSIGVGQMAGDIGGAIILLLSILSDKRPACTTSKSAKGASGKTALASCGSCICSLPWSMAWLAALYSASFLIFLSDMQAVAVAAQVAMGTLYVLMMQGCNEMVEWCSIHDAATSTSTNSQQSSGDNNRGSSSVQSRQSYAALSDVWFCIGCSIGTALPYVVLEQLSADWVCYLAASAVAAYYTVFVLVFGFAGRGVVVVASASGNAEQVDTEGGHKNQATDTAVTKAVLFREDS
jgi:hypothetical protein